MATAKPKQPPKPAAPKPDTSDPDVQLNDYVCVEPVKLNGKRHEPNDPIELSEVDAMRLLDQHAIRKAETGARHA